MKKFLTLLLVFSLAGFSLVSCGDDPADGPDNEQGTGGGEDKPGEDDKSTLTPGEHQKKLEDVAKQFVAYFDAADHKELVESLAKLDSYLYDEDEPIVSIDYEYYVGLSLDYYMNQTIELYSISPYEQVSVTSIPDFITRAEIRFDEDRNIYMLEIDGDLSKMELSGNTEGIIELSLKNEQRHVRIAVGYNKNFSEYWASQTGYYGNNGEGRLIIGSPFLAQNISRIKLDTYGREGYFNNVSITVSPDNMNVYVNYSVNRNVAGTARGRIDMFLDGKQIYAIDVEYDSYYEDYNRSAAWLRKSGTLSMLRGAAAMSARSVTSFMISAVSAPDYTYDLNEYKGLTYTYDNESEEWIESEGAGDGIAFKWDDSEAVISWTDGGKAWEGKVDYDESAKIYIPSEIKISVKIKGKEHLGVKLTPNFTDNHTVAPQAVVTLNGGYAFTANAEANSKGVQASVTVAKGDTKIATAKAYMSINDITDTDNWFEQESYTWEDGYGVEHTEYYNYSILDEYIEDNAKSGEASVDILSVSIYAKGDIRAIVTGSEAIENTESQAGATEQAALINKNIEAYMYYNDKKERVADIEMQPYLSDWYEYDQPNYNGSRAYDEEYWSVEPVLVFPDKSKFAFEDYFTSQKFSLLIDAVEEFISAYENIIEAAQDVE